MVCLSQEPKFTIIIFEFMFVLHSFFGFLESSLDREYMYWNLIEIQLYTTFQYISQYKVNIIGDNSSIYKNVWIFFFGFFFCDFSISLMLIFPLYCKTHWISWIWGFRYRMLSGSRGGPPLEMLKTDFSPHFWGLLLPGYPRLGGLKFVASLVVNFYIWTPQVQLK